jgi:hypothetical protein
MVDPLCFAKRVKKVLLLTYLEFDISLYSPHPTLSKGEGV